MSHSCPSKGMYQQIILASGSPRRREIMTRVGINYQYVTSDIKEELNDKDPFDQQAIRLAAMKGYNVANIYDNAFIIAADTLVVLDGKAYGKPKSADDVRATLTALSGKRHEVITGVAVLNKRQGFLRTFSETTAVYFKPISKKFIEWYIESEEPFDKAGSYAIQGKGSLLVDKIEGNYDNVVGLPVSKLFDEMIAIGIRLPGGPDEI